jgi:glycosyltransferase involved in cell wall biosynthesis
MKRVAIVCRGCGEGGSVARVALRHASELSRSFDVVLLSDSFPAGPQPFACVAVRTHQFPALRRFAHVPHELSFARSAKRALRRLHAERPVGFVLTHSHVVADRSAHPLRRDAEVPFGLVTHGDVFDRPPGTYDPLLTRLYRYATPRAYRSCDLVFALSPHMAECAIRGGAEPAHVVIVPNGIDPGELGLQASARRNTSRSGPIRLLFVGRLAVEKGVEDLIAACGLLADRGVDYHLTVIGDGPLASSLRERAAALQERVVFRGPRPRAELGAAYAAADLTCVPSLSEPLAGVVLESLAAGTPVLASDVGGNRFMVEHGKNGLLVPPASPAAIAAAVEELARDRESLQWLADGTAASLARFSWPAIGEQIAALIRPYV